MPRFQDIVTDNEGNGLPGAIITVRDYPSGNLSTLTADSGGSLTNPIVADANGAYYFNAANAIYSLEFRLLAYEAAREVRLVNLGNLVDSVTLAATTGAALIGASDGSSGSLFTTVAGFIAKLLSSAGSSVIGFIQSGAGAVARSVQDKLRERTSPNDFGADPTGIADSTAALNAFSAAVAGGKRGVIPAGTYRFTSALNPVVGNNVSIAGDGGSAILLYTGASTAPGDLLTFGDGVTNYYGLDVRGFRIESTTALTAGNALRIKAYIGVDVDVKLGTEYATAWHLYDGVYFQTCTDIRTHNSGFFATNVNVKWHDGFELHMMNSTVKGKLAAGLGTGTGMILGGGCGGFYQENLTLVQQDYGVRINNTLSAAGNTEFFFDSGTIDTCKTADIEINDTTVNPLGKIISVDGWIASSVSHGIVVTNWTGGTLRLGGNAQMLNHGGDAIHVLDSTIRLVIASGAKINDNTGYAVSASAALAIECRANPYNNTAGNFNANITVANKYYGSQTVSATPTVQWPIDYSGNTITLANAANAALAVGSGVVTVSNPTNGHTAMYLLGGGAAILLGTTGTSFVAPTTTPGAGAASIQYDGGTSLYRLYNNFGSSQTFAVALSVKTRAAV